MPAHLYINKMLHFATNICRVIEMPPSVASVVSTLSALADVRDMLCCATDVWPCPSIINYQWQVS